VIAAIGVAVVVVLGAAPAMAQTDVPPTTAPGPPPLDADVLRAVALSIDSTRLNSQAATLKARRDDLDVKRTALDAQLTSQQAELDAIRGKIQEALDRLHTRAAETYRDQGAASSGVLDIERLQDLSSGARYADAATSADATEVDELDAQAVQQQKAITATTDSLRDVRSQFVDVDEQYEQLAARATSEQLVVDRLGGVPVMGESILTARQLAAWFRSTGAHASLDPGTSIDDLAQMYIDEGSAERVRGDLAFAQSVLETGSFSVDPGNNFAGIGTCDSCAHGYSFPTPRAGVRAQIQLLRSYADPDSRGANLSHPPVPELFGSDPATAIAQYDSFSLKGKVPLWNQMGNGNWATATDYAPHVLGIYQKMLMYSVLKPGSSGPAH
jgi:uncharacterized coiled-coil protein SlyX